MDQGFFPREAETLQQAIAHWNSTEQPYDLQRSLPSLFIEQASLHPEAVALQVDAQTYTYAEIDSLSNQLAYRLSKLGVGPEVLVAVFMECSSTLLLSILAILKAGGAFLPLDSANPSDRLLFILEDSQAALVLTQQALLPRLADFPGKLYCVDQEQGQGQEQEQERFSLEDLSATAIAVMPEMLAYVIYTSGSTGKPKGVMISHRAICNRLLWGQQHYALTTQDTVLQNAALGFDFALWEIFAPLIAGARLLLIDPATRLDGRALCEVIIRHHVTVVHFIPSLLRVFLEEPASRQCTSIRYLLAGGEALSVETQRRVAECLPACLYNQYGPTEATIDATYWYCEPDYVSATVPIGRPIANMQTYVLDEQLRLVPPGTPGELYIGGVGLARGYMHRPDSTAAAFVPDPFSQLPGQRLYRTGDLARYGTDGVLEFLGRADEQVKIRGFRIEPGEIASTLRRHPAISDALVMAHTERSGEPKLIAWLIPAAPHAQFPSKETLLAFLQIYLPDYMIPMRLHFLDAFPLNANGKIDRQALLALGQAADERALAQAYSAPRSELEKAIAAIWQELLEIDQVGLDDDFQALGGHSLLAMQLLARIRAYFQVDLSLVSFFNAPTVAGQVKAILTQETKPGQALHLASLLNKIRTLSPHQMEELGQKLQYT